MTALVAIGEFARMSHLPVKTLRYYHDIGLLTPAHIDDHSGYRRYSTDQATEAHLIRRLRDLDMPVEEVRAVLTATDVDARNAALRAHLDRMERELIRTQQVVASLRDLLGAPAALHVEYRTIPPTPIFAVRDRVARADIGPWCEESFPKLYELGGDLDAIGGATYSTEFFEADYGECVAFVPAAAGPEILPGGRFAVAVHAGGFDDFDRTYGALGAHVAEHDEPLPDPIRERYVIGPNRALDPTTWRTEICWPIAG